MATYNCTDSTKNTYGSGLFGTCTGQPVGAPNTGVFEQIVNGGTFTVLLPLVAAVVIVRHRRDSRPPCTSPTPPQPLIASGNPAIA